MDAKQLIKDVFSLNFNSFFLRGQKLKAVLKRTFLLSLRKNYANGKDIKNIPVIINNRNRHTFMLQLIDWLEKNGHSNIYIIDNNSTYPPLLDYYLKTKYHVFRLKENVGHLALWKTDIYKQFYNDYYIYTDPDVVPAENCPSDAVSFMMDQLKRFAVIEKIGFGLKIDDLPEHYENKKKVIEWESNFWKTEIIKDVYDAKVDTTFALYRPYTIGSLWVQKAYRTGGNYVARHLPWYENSKASTVEDTYYKMNVRDGASHWIPTSK